MEALRPCDLTTTDWIRRLLTPAAILENANHFWASDPSALVTTSAIEDFTSGTGEDIYRKTIAPLLLSAEREIILVTCFWARSSSLDKISSALVELSRKSLARGSRKIQVKLCFSSRSVAQKLFHTTSLKGQVYPPSTWVSKLGLPPPDQLQGLDLEVKSIFFLPFSVLHPKFVVVDRRIALLPSCNVSWESWLECCLKVSGPIVANLLDFWMETWESENLPTDYQPWEDLGESSSMSAIRASLLPSQHHRNPRFRPFFSKAAPVPPTPLNTYLLHVLTTARHSIDITTPNLTCAPILSVLLDALARGIDVSITTCRRMMVAEQIVTAGTITEYSVWRLVRQYKKLVARTTRSTTDLEQGHPMNRWSGRTQKPSTIREHATLDEQGQEELRHSVADNRIGHLHVSYFKPITGRPEVKCHVKCTVIDDAIVVLGSGNMDRASWYTSQELGITLENREIVGRIMQELHHSRAGLLEDYYDSA